MRKKRERKTNLDVLKAVLAIAEAYEREHPNDPILTEKFKTTIKALVDEYGDDPDVFNVKLNKVLKPSSQFLDK